MKSIQLLAGCLAIVASAPAFPGTFTTDAPTTLKVLKDRGAELSTFNGRISISGKFVASWERDSDEKPQLSAVFVPDRDSSARLPYDADRGRVSEIWLRNGLNTLSTFIEPATRRDLLARRLISVEVDADVVLSGYRTAIDCDKRGYSAIVLNGRPVAIALVAQGVVGRQGC
jgi:hypothetical protein